MAAFGNTPPAVRMLLAELNTKSPRRFTSLIRFTEDSRLASVWTHDRENPSVDLFPLGLPIQASYCALVHSANDTCVIEDARASANKLPNAWSWRRSPPPTTHGVNVP